MAPPGESVIENTKRNTYCSNSGLLLFSPLFTQTTFLKASSMRKKLRDFVPPPIINLRDIHNSVVSTADKCFRFLQLFASVNPLLKTLLGVPSQVHSLCHQIRCRNSVNFNLKGLSNHNFAAVLPGDSVAGLVVANGVLNFLNLYNTLLVVRLVLTWFPNSPPAIVGPLSTICDPYLNIFRGLIPPLGGTLDLSPILAFLVLNVFTSTASALPAELPVPLQDNTHQTSQKHPPSSSPFSHLTSSQKKWFRRLHGSKNNREC